MDLGPVVVDVSSDDEPEDFNVCDTVDFSYDLINQWLNNEEGKDVNNFVDLDQYLSSVENSCSLKLKSGAARDDSDDDCMVLDGDPDKQVVMDNDKGDERDGSDDLCIVGQKGQVACRDFAHSRHLCANFPFNTTSHEKYCNLCHCFVCDSPAPCIYWGTGVSVSDHCHATDKDERWKLQRRKSFQKINSATLPLQKLPVLEHPLTQPIRNSELIFHRIPVPIPIQTFKTNSVRPCSATVTSRTNVPTQRNHQNPANIYHGPSIFQRRTSTESAQRQPVQRVNHSGLGLAPMSHSQFKRAGTTESGLISTSMTRPQHTASSPNQMNKTSSQRPQHLPAASVGSEQRTQHTASSPNQMHRAVPQRPQRLPAASVGSEQRIQHTASSPNQMHRAVPRRPQHLPAALVGSEQRSQHTASSPNQMHRTAPQRSHHLPAASLGSQQRPVALPRSRSMPVTAQRSFCSPLTTQMLQKTTVASPEDDSMRKWQDILAGVAAELGVSDSFNKSTMGAQPYTASAQSPVIDTLIQCQTNSNQGIGLHADVGPTTIPPHSIDFDPRWFDSSVGQNFPEHGAGGDSQLATMQPSDPLVSQNEAVSGGLHLESFLAAIEESGSVPGKEIGLPEDPASYLYDLDCGWSSIENV